MKLSNRAGTARMDSGVDYVSVQGVRSELSVETDSTIPVQGGCDISGPSCRKVG
jgi:hypothetical protein